MRLILSIVLFYAALSAPIPILVPTDGKLDPIHLENVIGNGSCATVYIDTTHTRAVKIFDRICGEQSDSAHSDPSVTLAMALLINYEITILNRVGLYLSSGMTDNDKPFIAMQYLSGHHLNWYVAHGYIKTAKDLIPFENALLRTLAFLHQTKGIIHGDIHHRNVKFHLKRGKVHAHLVDYGDSRLKSEEGEELEDELAADLLFHRVRQQLT